MTNATTGGGDGAAPATTEGTAPAPERLLPTRPGWWWVRRRRTASAIPGAIGMAEVYRSAFGMKLLAARLDGASFSIDNIEWLAEVPPPAVCAAWAAGGRPSAAVLEAVGVYGDAYMAMDADRRAGGSYANGEAHRMRVAEDVLRAAIRAERAARGSAQAGQGVA